MPSVGLAGSTFTTLVYIYIIVRYLTPRATELLVHAFITSRLDSWNALLQRLFDDRVRCL